jgi:outer membrane protein TolC
MLTVAALIASAASAAAQSREPTPQPIRLGDLYAQVQRGNPRITAARELVRAAQARVPGARRPPDPQLQLAFMNYALPGLAPMATLGMAQLQLMQMLPIGGKLSLGGRVADAQTAAAEHRAQDVGWSLRSRTAMAFYDLYTADRQLEVARETLHLLREAAAAAQSMYRVGTGRQTDVLRAQVEIARMAEDTLRMQAMRRTMSAKLDALRNGADVASVGSPTLPRFPDALPARAWLDSMSASRPMIRAGEEEVRAATASARLARRELLPDLQIGVQYAQRGGTMAGTGTTDMPAERTTERMGSLMIGASIPIFARDRQLQMRNEANAMKAMAEADLAAMRAETRGEIGEAYAALERARRLGKLYRGTVLPQAEAAAASALSAYRSSQVDFMTLLDDRMTVNRYRQELIALVADEGKSWAELEMLVGHELLDPNSVGADPMTVTATAERAKEGVR